MQRDVKIGIAIGVLLIALIGIFWWAKSGKRHAGRTEAPVTDATPPAPPVEPVPPVAGPGVGPVTGGPAVTVPPAGPVAGPTAGPAAAPKGTPTGPAAGPTGPGPVAGPVAAPAPEPAAARTHVVAAGETLSSIAKKYYNDESKWHLIVDANKGVDPKALKVGTKLTIPEAGASASAPAAEKGAASAERKHTVAAGDTLSSISKKYYGTDAKWKLIYNANREHIPNENQLKVGVVLTIPSDK